MNILLDAYFDNNFGDDIFIEVITSMFPRYRFYAFLEYYPEEVCIRMERISNLYLLPECNVFLQKNMFDAYICIGGDVFPDEGDYCKRRGYVKAVKEAGGIIAFLGFSLYHSYGEKTRIDIRGLMEDADLVAVRDHASEKILKDILGDKEIMVMSDLAFHLDWMQAAPPDPQERQTVLCLGIAVRRPENVTDQIYQQYCTKIAEAMEDYLTANPKGKIKMLALSDGNIRDIDVINDIMSRLKNNMSVEIHIYQGDTLTLAKELSRCSLVVCTRLHAMIACTCMGVPYIPVVYEVKMEHLLDEIGYHGRQFVFGDLEELSEYLRELTDPVNLTKKLWSEELLHKYMQLKKPVLNRMRQLLTESFESDAYKRLDHTGPFCKDKDYGLEQAKIVQQKNLELELGGEVIRQQQQTIEECQDTIIQYLKSIDDCNESISSYHRTVEDCNETINNYHRTIEELNQQRVALEEELEEVKKREEEKSRLLQEIRPFFLSRTGRLSHTLVIRSLQGRIPDIERAESNILQYFEQTEIYTSEGTDK